MLQQITFTYYIRMEESSLTIQYSNGYVRYTDNGIISLYPDLKKALNGEYVSFVIPIEFNEYMVGSPDPNQKAKILELLDKKKLNYKLSAEKVTCGIIQSYRIFINMDKLEDYYYG